MESAGPERLRQGEAGGQGEGEVEVHAPTIRPGKPYLQVYLPQSGEGSSHPSKPDCEESRESSSSGG